MPNELMNLDLSGSMNLIVGTERPTPLVLDDVAKSLTGVKYDAGKPRMDLISPFALEELGKVLAYGAKKYADRNWEKGFPWSRIIGATMRHTVRYMMGETIDPETGLSHAAAIMCNAMFLLHFEKTHPELDDRPKYDLNDSKVSSK